MLGIEPHSSSSQLSRAKRMLRYMMNNSMLVVLLLLIISIPLYFIVSRHDEVDVCEVEPKKEGEQHKPIYGKGTDEKNNSCIRVIDEYNGGSDRVSVLSDTMGIFPVPDVCEPIEQKPLITETAEDTTETVLKDRIPRPVLVSTDYFAHKGNAKRNRWQLLATGSLGTALAQNVYKIFATNLGDNDIDLPSPVLPDNVNTWEDFSNYLHIKGYEITPPIDTLALMEIADHNSGEIVEHEKHDKPVSFALSLTKVMRNGWSIETGLQYSLLNSRFTMGENGYSIVRKQKVHYLGLPLKLSHNLIDYKQLSVYGSVGFTLHIPVYGKVNSNYMVNWRTTYTESRYFVPSLQWQTGLSVGLQYKFTSKMGIFVEPTLNWFIPFGNKANTIWTAHPIVFTTPFGIRMTW